MTLHVNHADDSRLDCNDRRTIVPPKVVQVAIARAVRGLRAGMSTQQRLGDVTLLPHQIDAEHRLLLILRREHVALLADDVGMGKTFTALAVARHYPHVHIIAPAALLPMWREALARARMPSVHVESLHRYSNRRTPVQPPPAGALIVIDEAHHLRTPTTNRYRAIATLSAGGDLLLLSATPVHNSPRDLQALLALSLGAQANVRPELLGRVVVRRTQRAEVPDIRPHAPIVVPHDPALLEQILALPAPLPAHDGAVAGALIRLGLLRAWCSSDAALAATLRRRLLRGEALQQALSSGRHPTAAELRTWIVGEHEVQLAFPELLAARAPETGPLLEVLTRHLDAIRRLYARVLRTDHGDPARADALRTLLQRHPDRPIVAFSQFAETVRAIRRALSDIAGVGALNGRNGWIASGSVTRDDVLARFAPIGQGRPPPPPHQRIRLLITTDLLAEGVNLQDAGVVVHLDLPWTNALRRQRVGRAARIGSPHATVEVYQVQPPTEAAAALRLLHRLRRKARLAHRLVGTDVAARNAQRTVQAPLAVNARGVRAVASSSAADATTAIHAILERWLPAEGHGPDAAAVAPGAVLVAEWRAAVDGALVLMRASTKSVNAESASAGSASVDSAGAYAAIADPVGPDSARMLFGISRARRPGGSSCWRMSRSSRRVLQLVQRVEDGRGRGVNGNVVVYGLSARGRVVWSQVSQVVSRWRARSALSAEIGDDELLALPVHRRVSAELRARLARVPLSRRLAQRAEYALASRVLRLARGAAAEESLRAWLRTARVRSTAWEAGWRDYPVLVRLAAQGPSTWEAVHQTERLARAPESTAGDVVAVLLLVCDRLS